MANITHYSSKHATEITELFYKAVYDIDTSIYSDKQKAAWAPLPIDYDKWKKRLADKKPYLLMIENQLAGFIELEADGHIDCAYVLPEYQKTGVGTVLLQHVINEAKRLGITELYVEASIVAKPLFEKFAFIVKNRNDVIRNGVTLINYSMCLRLDN